MTTKDAIRFHFKTNRWLTLKYLADLSDDELLVRPAPGANHIAWQLGHCIFSEVTMLLSNIPGADIPSLPGGFVEQHSDATAKMHPPNGFLSKNAYLRLMKIVRDSTLAALDTFPEAMFDDDPKLGWGDLAPNYGSLFMFFATHEMMHTGQFTIVRRLLGKPVAF